MTQPPTGGKPETLGDRYEIGGLLGRGGMADVRVGRDIRLGRTVAIKRLRSDLASDPTFQARFQREAHSAASLNHPSIVAVYDTGEETASDGHRLPYIVMEYVEGKTLRDVLREGRKILPERALEIAADVLSALDYSHRAGIVHRDIKPANVMLTPGGRVKVMDFGIARAVADSSATMTQTAAVVGTAQYLSPEQARGEQVDARSDIYSTGCLLFELLAERPPFVGDSPVAVAYQHVREEPPAPSSFNPEVTEAMDAVVAKALAKRTEERYQSAAEMRADIERILAGQTIQAPFAAAPTAVTPAVEEPEPTSFFPTATEEDEEPRRRRRTGLWIALLLVLAALVAAAFFVPQLLSNDPQPDIAVPGVVGENRRAAVNQIEDAGLTVGEITVEPSDAEDAGKVVNQSPDEGEFAFEEDPVDLVVGGGPDEVQVPYLLDDNRKTAGQRLRELDLEPEFEYTDSEEPRNSVVSTDPVPGEMLEPGDTVTVVLSNGPVTVPGLVGLTEEEARERLDNRGLEADVVYDPNSEEEAGTVIDQSPDEGAEASPGDTVTLTVSSRPTETTPTTDTTTPPTTTPTTDETTETTPPGGGPITPPDPN